MYENVEFILYFCMATVGTKGLRKVLSKIEKMKLFAKLNNATNRYILSTSLPKSNCRDQLAYDKTLVRIVN